MEPVHFILERCVFCLTAADAQSSLSLLQAEMHQREEKEGRTCTNKWVGGWQPSDGDEKREAFMYDRWEVERVAACQMFPLSLLCVFDMQSEGRSDKKRAGELRSENGRQWWSKGRGKRRGKWEEIVSRVTRRIVSPLHILNEARKNIMQISLNGLNPSSVLLPFPTFRFVFYHISFFVFFHCPIYLCPYLVLFFLIFFFMPSCILPNLPRNPSLCLPLQTILIIPFSFSKGETMSSISTSDMLADQKMNGALVM